MSYKRSPRGAEWFLESVPDPNKPETIFGMSTPVITPFEELMRRWLVDCPLLRRLAFGAALYLQVKDRTEGYRLLSRWYLRLELNLKKLGDFMYQANRRRATRCGVPNLEINRISKWTSLGVGLRAPDGEQSWPVRRLSACSLELDINTALDFLDPVSGEYVPFRGPLPRESYVALFNELADFAKEIAVEGDVE